MTTINTYQAQNMSAGRRILMFLAMVTVGALALTAPSEGVSFSVNPADGEPVVVTDTGILDSGDGIQISGKTVERVNN